MKIVFRQYLSSLRERGELDAVLPDLLSELGYIVISRPSIGTRQYGVDVAALGPSENGTKRKLYLFSIKQGDLTRTDWDGPAAQALRPSINEILDVYIDTQIPQEHQGREIVVCLCFGGEIHEAVRGNVKSFTDRNTRRGLTFEQWSGDYIAELLVKGILREQLVDKSLRSSFQKAIAMVDEPDISYIHFEALIKGLCSISNATPRQRVTILRQLYICLWVLFVWARDAGNLEAPYRVGERALLHAWQLIHEDIARDGKQSEEIGAAYSELANLYFNIWDALLGQKIIPYAGVEHAVSVAVDSTSTVDVNLKLFETLGRLAFRGLCFLWSKSGNTNLPEARENWESPEADNIAQSIVQLIRNNPILLNPIADVQVVEIATTLMFLAMTNEWRPAARGYVEALINRITFAYSLHNRYPTFHDDYRSLLEHPRERTDEYRRSQTKGSTLFPFLSIWATSLGASKEAEFLADFSAKNLDHCNMQFWFAGPDTEEKVYVGDIQHGLALNNIPITADGKDAFKILLAECDASRSFAELSAIELGHWTILILACRHYRLPLPPNLWIGLLKQLRDI